MFYITGVVLKQSSSDVLPKPVELSKPEAGEEKAKNIAPAKPNGRGRNMIKVDINVVHELLGHVGVKSLKETANLYDVCFPGILHI